MSNRYHVTQLDSSDAAAVAQVEAIVYPQPHRSGRKIIKLLFEDSESEGRNLSLGLCCDNVLVGYLLFFIVPDRHCICDYFDAELPPGLDPSGPLLYTADVAVDPKHRRASWRLTRALKDLIASRPGMSGMNFDAFATEECTELWMNHGQFMDCLGWRLTANYPIHDRRLNTVINWLTFVPVGPTATGAELERVWKKPGTPASAAGNEILAAAKQRAFLSLRSIAHRFTYRLQRWVSHSKSRP